MRHGQGTRYNTDVHNAVSTIKKYNADQEIDEAPYNLGGARAKDWAMSKLGGKMSKGRHGAGKLSNQVNDEWQTFMGTKGYNNAEEATIKDLDDFIQKIRPGTDSKAFFDKVGLTNVGPQVALTTKQQDDIVGELGAALAQQGAGQEPAGDGATTGTTTGTTAGGGGGGSSTQAAADLGRLATGGSAKTDSPAAGGDTPVTSTPSAPTTAKTVEFLGRDLSDEQLNELGNHIKAWANKQARPRP